MKTIDTYNFKNKRAIIRVDFNVPLNSQYEITDDTRIRAAMPTVQKILADGGSVILMSHLGRPKEGPEEKFSLVHLIPTLEEKLNLHVQFAPDCIGDQARQMAENLSSGEVLLLENLRFYKEEAKGNKEFAEKLAGLADVYVNDAFGTAHRAHASTTIIANFFPEEKLFGYVIQNELNSIDSVIGQSRKPFTAILGGAKVSSKITIIENLLSKVDNLIIGGGMTYTFVKAMGGSIGNSLVETDYIDTAKKVMEKAKEAGVKLLLPIDSVNGDAFDNDAKRETSSIDAVPENWLGMDIGDKTIELFCNTILNSSTILWNGPMGVFEMSNFQKGTFEIAQAITESTQNGAFSLVGGGDSVAAVNKFNMADKVSYVSTGGGALLEYIEGKELPGIKAIREK
ncbi:MAG: phosphoglycerate kinase [Bacteroidetes bacterium]|jgi:phosphoglycerate kinase|nr:phosphoglycerate kinase [Bacteroidota bacterium]MBT4402074.1 phosphoglycerate kinase [Bacteroidota bacterium]MBT4408726.1 phosphoglycerate kinase [Bacteroidota bacterium]MBT7094124.1 phosphoglycerate kinase [Bacteroidota bacterium]MBT7466016.1 phosphoglycerate kinase [Bacteroidota bacterium]